MSILSYCAPIDLLSVCLTCHDLHSALYDTKALWRLYATQKHNVSEEHFNNLVNAGYKSWEVYAMLGMFGLPATANLTLIRAR